MRTVRLTLTVALLAAGCGGGEEAPRPARGAPDAPRTAEVPDRLGLGRAATPEEVAAWDIDVDPSGATLPPGSGTVAQGRDVFRLKCAACHGVAGEGGVGPRLVATEPMGGFAQDPRLPRAIGNWWPYASTVFDYVRRAMPQNLPGSLTNDETYALVAFLLAENHAVPPDFVADRTSVPAVDMPERVEFVPDDRLETNEFR